MSNEEADGTEVGRDPVAAPSRPTPEMRARLVYGYLVIAAAALITAPLFGPVVTEAVLGFVFVAALATLSGSGWWNRVAGVTAFAAAFLVCLTVAPTPPRLDPSPEIGWAVAFLRAISFVATLRVALREGSTTVRDTAVWAHLRKLLRLPLVNMGLYVFALVIWGMTFLNFYCHHEVCPRH